MWRKLLKFVTFGLYAYEAYSDIKKSRDSAKEQGASKDERDKQTIEQVTEVLEGLGKNEGATLPQS